MATMIGALAWSGTALASKRVAVVVGISDYAALPDGTELPRAESDAAALGSALKQSTFDKVYVLLGQDATHAAVEELLLGQLPGELAPGDSLMWVFVGHGFGADFGDPYLLLSDSHIEDADRTALKLFDFSRDLGKALTGVNLSVFLDAAHDGAASGVALLGPTARSLPTLPPGMFVLSATGPDEVAPDGLFVPVLIEGLRGGADTNTDAQISAGELYRYTLGQVAARSKESAHPVEAGSYDANITVAPVLKNLEDTPSLLPPTRPVWQRPVAFSMIGAGVVVGGGLGVLGNVRAREACTVHDGAADCLYEADKAEYLDARRLALVGYGVGAALSLGGVALTVVPLDGGGLVGWNFRF